MKKKLIEELLLVSFFIIMIAVLIQNAFSFPKLARYAPFLIGGVTLVLLGLQFFFTFKKMKQYDRKEITQEDVVKGMRLKGFILLLIAFLPAVYYFGFILITGITLVIYFKLYADLNIIKSILVSLLTCTIIYVVFVLILSIRLPEGSIW